MVLAPPPTLEAAPERALRDHVECAVKPSCGQRTADQDCSRGPRRQAVESRLISQRPQEAIIVTGLKPASWTYAEEFIGEDEVLTAARARAEEVGVSPIGTGGGAALRFLTSVTEARAVVEIGTGTGISGVWMLRGMRPDGVLTTVDTEAEHQRLAKQAFTEAGIPTQRVRLIPGAALDVLPRLTDGHYDLVFADGDKTEYGEYLTEALRLLKPGGIVAFDNALWHDRVADPAQRDAETVAIRQLGLTVRDHESLLPVLLPVGDGLLVAKKVWTPGG
jgi:predicted O-methyltransferase YrrM